MEMLIHPVKEKIKQLNVQVQTLQEKLSQCLVIITQPMVFDTRSVY